MMIYKIVVPIIVKYSKVIFFKFIAMSEIFPEIYNQKK